MEILIFILVIIGTIILFIRYDPAIDIIADTEDRRKIVFILWYNKRTFGSNINKYIVIREYKKLFTI